MTDRLCAVDGCDNPHEARGWCAAHYMRWRKYGDPLGQPPPRPPKQQLSCAVDGCGSPSYRRQWCSVHYDRWRRYSDPLGGGRRRSSERVCNVAGCDDRAVCWGMCRRCSNDWARMTRHGARRCATCSSEHLDEAEDLIRQRRQTDAARLVGVTQASIQRHAAHMDDPRYAAKAAAIEVRRLALVLAFREDQRLMADPVARTLTA